MIGRLKALFETTPAPDGNGDEDALRLSAAALLAEAAVMDGHMDADETATIETLLAERFGLDEVEARDLLAAGREAIEETGELYRFTRTIKDAWPHEDRVKMLEMLWRVVLADGTVDHFESNLIRRVAGLLYVPDGESGAARKRVEATRA